MAQLTEEQKQAIRDWSRKHLEKILALLPGEVCQNGNIKYVRSLSSDLIRVTKFGYVDDQADQEAWYWVSTHKRSDLRKQLEELK